MHRPDSPARRTRTQRALELPAYFVAFDLLYLRGQDIRAEPLSGRRARLENLMRGIPPPLQVSPATSDRDEAEQWLSDYTKAGVGIEGLVVKGLGQPYLSGQRAWRKLRVRNLLRRLWVP